MAFKSEAQRRKLYELHKQGKISKAVIDEFEKSTGGKQLPERAPKPKPKAKTKQSKPWFAKEFK